MTNEDSQIMKNAQAWLDKNKAACTMKLNRDEVAELKHIMNSLIMIIMANDDRDHISYETKGAKAYVKRMMGGIL